MMFVSRFQQECVLLVCHLCTQWVNVQL